MRCDVSRTNGSLADTPSGVARNPAKRPNNKQRHYSCASVESHESLVLGRNSTKTVSALHVRNAHCPAITALKTVARFPPDGLPKGLSSLYAVPDKDTALHPIMVSSDTQ